MSGIIHRIFFNFNDGDDPFVDYLETWKRELPDFEIMLWDKTNLPLDLNEYTRTLAAEKNHAFLSDYFRCWLLEKYGGLYLDADIEILDGQKLRKLYEDTQSSAEYDMFIGVESASNGQLTAHSMGVKSGTFHPILRFMMGLYEHSLSGPMHYAMKRLDMPFLMSLYFFDKERQEGYRVSNGGLFRDLKSPLVTDRINILPPVYLSPLTTRDGTMTVTSFGTETCLCHHFAATWNNKANGTSKAKTLIDSISCGDYAASGAALEIIRSIYPNAVLHPQKPRWSLKEREIKQIENALNFFIPYASPLYKILKGKVRG